jgi:uncharacterized cupredoxin-like copper-binding protein
MGIRHRSLTFVGVAVVVAAVGIAGCSSSKKSASTANTPAASSGASSSSGAGTAVTATETEFAIVLSQSALKAGTYTFHVKNNGKLSHNLVIKGPGVGSVASPTEPGGGSATVTATLTAGTYELWCGVPGHKDKGMDTHITVT